MTEEQNKNIVDPVGRQTLEIISKANRFNRWMYSKIRPFIKNDVLEIGAGIGNISKYIVKDEFNTVLSDYNFEYCDILKKEFSTNLFVKEVLQIDLLRNDFADHFISYKEKFDTIILLNVIEHLEDDSTAVINCKFLLKPGGHFIVLAPAYKWLYCNLDKQLGHYRRYSMKKLKTTISKEGFEIINRKHINFLGIFGWFFFGKFLKKKAIGKEMNSFEWVVPFARFLDVISFQKIGLSAIVTGKKQSK